MEADNRQPIETIDSIANGLNSVAGMHYPHPACPRHYNEFARRELENLGERIKAARDYELARLRAAAKEAFNDALEVFFRLEIGAEVTANTRDAARKVVHECAELMGGAE